MNADNTPTPEPDHTAKDADRPAEHTAADRTATDRTPTIPASAEPTSPAPSDDPAVAHTLEKRTPSRRRILALAGGAAVTTLVLGLGTGFAVGANSVAAADGSSTAASVILPADPGTRYAYPYGYGADRSTATTSTQETPVTASDAQISGVVTILTEVDYGAGEAAGTGIILTSDGTILTNNHVIDGATSIEVTVESTGQTYSASVVGYDAAQDVAVLQLDGASGLTPATLDDDGDPAVGDAVTSVGNADGTGTLVAATGSVSGLDESITAGDASGGDSEQLSGLIEVDAYVVAGDSGGPLLDADGEVVGVVTAASSGSPVVTGYAIDIDTALAVAQQIEAGEETGTVQIGLPAFLGVLLSGQQAAGAGAVLGGVVAGSPAAAAGLAAGDVITAVDGTAVTTPDELSAAIAASEPGDSVTVTYTDATGTSMDVTVVLAEGPAA